MAKLPKTEKSRTHSDNAVCVVEQKLERQMGSDGRVP